MNGVASDVDGSCNGVSAGGVGNKNGASSSSSSSSSCSSTSAGRVLGERPYQWVWQRRVASGVFFSFVWVLVELARKEFWTGTD